MRTLGREVLLAAVVSAVLILVGVVCAVADQVAAALVCVLLVQGIGVLAVLDTRRRQSGLAAATPVASDQHAEAIEALGRQVVNVSERLVSETSLLQDEVRTRVDEARAALERDADHRLQDVQAMIQLFGRFEPRAAVPAGGMAPSGSLGVVELVARRRAATIVELGTGPSTLWSSYALQQQGTGGRIVSLDHDARRAATTRELLAAHGFADGVAEVRDAPLAPDVLEGHLSPWYDPHALDDLADIDLLVIAGPPVETGHQARYPAVPVLLSRLAPGAVVVVDEASAPDEIATIERWVADVPGLRRLEEAGSDRQVVLVLEG